MIGDKPGRVCADCSVDSVNAARSAAKDQGIQNVEFQEGDAQDLSSLESESFDIVHAHQVLLHLSQPVTVLREMRRVAKPGGIISTRDCVRRILAPPEPKILEHLEKFYQYSRNKGAEPDFGLQNHEAAHAAGFEWDNIEMSSWGTEESGNPDREMWAQTAKDFMREALTTAGIATVEQMDEYSKVWEEWGRNRAGRMMMLDSALLCWK